MLSLLVWIAMGALVGWIASLLMRVDSTQGALLNIVTGIVGAFVGGLLFRTLGAPASTINETISVQSVIVSIIGAVIVIALLQLLRRSTRAHV